MLTFKIGANLTESPVSTKTITPVTRCSRTPKNCGRSPGALVSVSILRESMCPRQSTVAATHQGRPNIEHTPIIVPHTNMSKWYPKPFYRKWIRREYNFQIFHIKPDLSSLLSQKINTLSLCSFLFTITDVICWSINRSMVSNNEGNAAAMYIYHSRLGCVNGINHFRSGCVGYKENILYNNWNLLIDIFFMPVSFLKYSIHKCYLEFDWNKEFRRL